MQYWRCFLALIILVGNLSLPRPAAANFDAQDMRDIRLYTNTLRNDRKEANRAKAAVQLGMIGHPASLTPLFFSLENDVSSQVRINSANAIARINKKFTVKSLWRALRKNTKRIDVQIAIIRALGDMKQNAREITPQLLKLLRHSSPFVREATAEAIWKIGDRQNFKYLVRLLNIEKDPSVKLFITSVVAEFRDPNSIPVLEKLMADPKENARVKELADIAISKLRKMGIKAPPKPKAKAGANR